MAKKLVCLCAFSLLFSFPPKVLAECVVQGPNIPDPTIENINLVRQMYGSNNCQIQVTIRLTESTAADYNEMLAKVNALKANNLVPTFRIDGATTTQLAVAAGQNLSKVLSGMKTTIEFGNEVNLVSEGFSSSGTKYGEALASFLQACSGCQVYLPALGGAPGSEAQGGQKETFAKELNAYMSSKDPNWLAKISGVVFNSIANDPYTALTDWVKTRDVWVRAGVNLSGKSVFLTEVSPAGALVNSSNVDSFVKEVVAKFKLVQAQYPELRGFTFFFWDENEDKWMVFIDAKDNIIKQKMGAGGNLPSSFTPTSTKGIKNKSSTGDLQKYDEESRQACDVLANAQTNARSAPAPIYVKTATLQQPEMRENAGLTFGSPVQGMMCGQVRSDPISLEEIAPYKLGDPLCVTRSWTGSLEIQNIAVPFAESLARHWAGDWDAEHVREDEFNSTVQRAISGNAEAARTILKRSGVLGVLLPEDQKDDLRRQFLEYFKYAQGSSLYQNFTIHGKGLGGIPLPPKLSSASYAAEKAKWATKMQSYFGDDWLFDWIKVPFFPNEQTWGEIKMEVCSDKEYRFSARYPEVMKLGLASNQLYKILTPKEVQENYFKKYPELNDPLARLAAAKPQESVVAAVAAPLLVSPAPVPKTESWLDKIKNFLGILFGKFNQKPVPALAAPNGKCFHLETSVDAQNNVTVCLVSDSGKDGDIEFHASINGGIEKSINVLGFNYKFHQGRRCTQISINPGDQVNFRVRMNSCDALGNEESCAVTLKSSGLISGCEQVKPPTPEPPCDETKSCCGKETKCSAVDCAICKRAQLAPSMTIEQDADATETIKNKQTVSLGTIDLKFLKPDIAVTPHPRGECQPDPLPSNVVKFMALNGEFCKKDENCAPDEVCHPYGNRGKFCTPLKCAHANTRSIDIYNNVPFLASIWDQSAGNGENGAIGFLNYFNPEIRNIFASTIDRAAFQGCTTDEKYVFDENGNFYPSPGAVPIRYANFNQTSGKSESDNDGVNVSMGDTPDPVTKPLEARRLMFYRIGGVCNANKWFSEQVLNPANH